MLASSTSSVGGHPVGRARAPRRHVDLAAHRAALAHERAPLEPAEEAGLGDPGGEVEVEPDGGGQGGHRAPRPSVVGVRCVSHQAPPSGTNASMSAMAPDPLGLGPEAGGTRQPVASLSGPPASTTWSMAVSAPSRRSAPRRTGWSSGCLGSGWAHPRPGPTAPPGPPRPARRCPRRSSGSYSVGGTITGPRRPAPRRSCPSRRPVRKAADHRSHRSRVRVLEDVTVAQDLAGGIRHPSPPQRGPATPGHAGFSGEK